VRAVSSEGSLNCMGLLAIFGFSARFTGGGPFLNDGSRLSSPDLRGGGGDGGCEADSLGDFPGSNNGVCGLLGILKCFGEGACGVVGNEDSVDKYVGALDKLRLNVRAFGGD
jgi:hypothetical protein